MEGKVDLSRWQAKNMFDDAVGKSNISEFLSFDNSCFREEQARTIAAETCEVVQVESICLESIKMWQLFYKEITRPVLSHPGLAIAILQFS